MWLGLSLSSAVINLRWAINMSRILQNFHNVFTCLHAQITISCFLFETPTLPNVSATLTAHYRLILYSSRKQEQLDRNSLILLWENHQPARMITPHSLTSSSLLWMMRLGPGQKTTWPKASIVFRVLSRDFVSIIIPLCRPHVFWIATPFLCSPSQELSSKNYLEFLAVMDWIVSLQKSYVEAVTPNVTIWR